MEQRKTRLTYLLISQFFCTYWLHYESNNELDLNLFMRRDLQLTCETLASSISSSLLLKVKIKGGEGEKVHFLGMVGFPRTTLFVVTVRKSILTSTQSDLLDSGGVCFVLQRAR